MHRTILLAAALLPLSFAVASAQSDDKRNVMLNAESATIPREINVGLPDSGNGASVFIDGMLHAFGLPTGTTSINGLGPERTPDGRFLHPSLHRRPLLHLAVLNITFNL